MLEAYRWNLAHKNIVVLLKHKLLFCPVPKVACSNWKITLRRSIGFTDDDETIAHDRKRNGLTYLNGLSAIQRTMLLARPDITRAVFVRNPWTRVLSAYRSKLEGVRLSEVPPDDGRHAFRRRVISAIRSDDEPVTFQQFLDYIEMTPSERLDEHWQPQTIVAGFGKISYTFIGRFEMMKEDAAALVKRCGISPFYTGDVRTVPATKSSRRDVWETYYTPDRVNQVARIYASDIEVLGYEPPTSL